MTVRTAVFACFNPSKRAISHVAAEAERVMIFLFAQTKQTTHNSTTAQERTPDTPEVLPGELLSLVAGGLPYNVGGYGAAGDSTETHLPYNVG